MLESIGVNGEYFRESAGARVINPGHSIELSWFLLDQALYSGDEELLAFSKNVFDTAFEFGWDETYGGILYFKDYEGYPVEAYEHDMKLWWPQCEAMIANKMCYALTGEKKYLNWYNILENYIEKYFLDNEDGEWYGYLHYDNTVSNTLKGNIFKGPFHIPRMLILLDNIEQKHYNNQKLDII